MGKELRELEKVIESLKAKVIREAGKKGLEDYSISCGYSRTYAYKAIRVGSVIMLRNLLRGGRTDDKMGDKNSG